MQLPSSFLTRMESFLGAEYADFVAALQQNSPTSIRTNPRKLETSPFADAERVAWAACGQYLTTRPSFTADPLFHAGAYYVQEASSMFLEQIWRHLQTETPLYRVLDLCAAPGGKSTHALSLLPSDSLVLCNEVIDKRSQILSENVRKWGAANAVVLRNEPKHIAAALPQFFDAILVDAPCSGEGMFRKDAASVGEWSPEAVERCATRQLNILREAWKSLRTGGYLIYSTCTYNEAENEGVWQQLSTEFNLKNIDIPNITPDWNIYITERAGIRFYRFMPHRTRGEGFCACVVQKLDEEHTASKRWRSNKPLHWLGSKQTAPLADWLHDAEAFEWIDHKGIYRAFLSDWTDIYPYLYERLNVVTAGVSVAEALRKGFVPLADLAFQTAFNRAVFPTIDLPLAQALAFLKLETFALAPDTPKGFVLATYRGQALGWLHNLGERFNNYYPSAWKIRMDIDTKEL